MKGAAPPQLMRTDVERLRQLTQSRACALCEIDLQQVIDKSQLIRHMLDALACPYASSSNFDALADALRDLSWLPQQRGVVCVLHGTSTLEEKLPATMATLYAVISDAVAFGRASGRPLLVLRSTDAPVAVDAALSIVQVSHLMP